MAQEGDGQKFDHVVSVMFENRSFDNLLGHLYQPDEVASFEGVLGKDLSNPIPGYAPGAERGAMPRAAGDFTPLYRTDEEWAAELSNDTVHGVLHLAWVEQGGGRYRAQMGVYAKPRGRLGEIYMMLIQPFRHLIVYPALMRHIGRAWDARDSHPGRRPRPRDLPARGSSHRHRQQPGVDEA